MVTNVTPQDSDLTSFWNRQATAAYQLRSIAHPVVLLIAITTVLHILAAAAVGLGNDEAYTVANARLFSLSYVDYPPLHVWMVGAWASITHSEAPLLLRLPFIAFFAGSTWLMYALTSTLYGPRPAFWAALALNLAPVYAIAHSTWILPDGPLTFFLLAAVLIIAKQTAHANLGRQELKAWVAIGLLTGLALLTKYHAVFLVAGTFVFLLTWSPGRALLRAPGPWIAAGIALAMFLPVLYWNAGHGWAGLFFQSARLTKHTDLSIGRVFANIGEQAAYLSPWLFGALALVLYHALRGGPESYKSWFMGLLAVGPILFFTAASYFAKGLPHWSMPGWLFAFPLLGLRLGIWEQRYPRAVHNFAVLVAAFTLCLLVLFIGEARYGWVTGTESARAAEHNPTLDLLDWRDLAGEIDRRHLIDPSTPAIAGTAWMTAGKLNYVLGQRIPVLCLCADPQQFRFLHNDDDFMGRNVIVIMTPWQYRHDASALRMQFKSFEALAPFDLTRHGRAALQLVVLRGAGFTPHARNGVQP